MNETKTLSEEMRANAKAADPMPRHISHLQWMMVPKSVRVQLADDLKLRPSTHTEVASTPSGGMREVSDGFTERDLLGLTPEVLQKYVNQPDEEDFDVLWTLAVRKADILLNSVAVPMAPIQIMPEEPRIEKEVLVRLNKPENVIPKVVAQPKKTKNAKTK